MNTKNLFRSILLCFLCLLGVGWWWTVSSNGRDILAGANNSSTQSAPIASPTQKASDEDENTRLQMLRSGGDSFLLGSPQVRRELDLSHEKSLQIIQLLNEAARLNRGGTMTFQSATKLKAERQKTDPDVLRRHALEQLSLRQLERLEQISNQGAAPFLLNNSGIARKIGASPQQIRRVQKTQEQEFKKFQHLLKPLNDEHFAEVRGDKPVASKKKILERERRRNQLGSEYLRRCRAALINVLTPDQEKRWRDLLGKPFTEKITYDTKSYPMD
jgi:hypothetical protein